jgi:hypothetical protein
MAMEVYAERNIFVSFVVAHTNDLYAMVYVKGISQFSKQNENKINGVSEDPPENYIYGRQLYNTGLKGSLGDKGKRIKFPTDKDEEEFLKKTMGKPPHVKAQMIAELELEMNYGQEFSELIWDHLNQVCCILHIGLYKSEGPILTLRNY